jgi:23S rRNA pseudouridine2457 synthase
MISQFVSPYEQRLLGQLKFDFPKGTHAIGRLDEESEGLLILSTDKTLTAKLMHPDRKHIKSYSVLVERQMTAQTIELLQNGIEILVKQRGAYTTLPCKIKQIEKPEVRYIEEPKFKEYLPHTWLQFELTEGKNRQIRKMCKAVKHKCKRLIRTSIEDLNLEDMKPGEVKEITKEKLFKLLKLTS